MYSSQIRRSNDRLAHCLIRSAYLLAGAMASPLFVTWVPRRSDTPSKVADDLTHMEQTHSAQQCPTTIFPLLLGSG